MKFKEKEYITGLCARVSTVHEDIFVCVCEGWWGWGWGVLCCNNTWCSKMPPGRPQLMMTI